MSKTITILMAIAFALVAIAAGASKEAGGTQARVSEDRAEAPTPETTSDKKAWKMGNEVLIQKEGN